MKLLQITHTLWSSLVKSGDTVIDATLGNGKDTLFLAKLLNGKGFLHAYDIQEESLQKSKAFLKSHLTEEEASVVHLSLASHVTFEEKEASLIVYNLGYLPGGNKHITTKLETTLQSLESAKSILNVGGAISITCYTGHDEGKKERAMLLNYLQSLSSDWASLHYHWINRKEAPELFLLLRER